MTDYMLVIEPLPEKDGGGFMGYFPDLSGCVADGETPSDAVANAMDALGVWMETQRERGIDVPAPGSARDAAARQIEAMQEQIASLEKELKEAREGIARHKARRQAEALAGLAWPPTAVLPVPPRTAPIAS